MPTLKYEPKEGTKASLVFKQLAHTLKKNNDGGLTPIAISELIGGELTEKEVLNVIRGHFMNPIHNSALQRAGLAVIMRSEGHYVMTEVEPNPDARRESRKGDNKKIKRAKAVKVATKEPKAAKTPKPKKTKAPKEPKVETPPVPRGLSFAEAEAAAAAE
jgi:hypothetical protein